ncbi:hypothetical protein FRZ44_37910 [Hypericibacter terrae]|uniref:Phage tail protein n=1 Tax=Hypericibacter terrae TaxID=2602015 RepID=A0A5J6MM11_9PROT|nr:phage tail protein [Hypericibacter terrae]QEX18484.1 hypothetical protein FRZ44_37910 [Hypericibacter terrae]
MARPTFSPPKAEDRPSAKSVEPRRIVNEFGDGYTQRSGDGLNTMPQMRDVSWSALTSDQADEIEAFFEARTGTDDAFDWTPSGEGSARVFIVMKWARSGRQDSGRHEGVQASFKEVFDL